MNKKYNVGNFGLFTSIIVTVIGIGIFSYPRDVVNIVGNDAVLVTIIAGLINIALLLYIIGALKLNNYEDLSTLIDNNFGRIIRKVVLFIFIAYAVTVISFGVRYFTAVVKVYMLEKTPIEFITIVIVLTGGYHLRKGLDNIIGFNEFIFWFMFIPAFLLLIFPLQEADFTNLLPIFTTSPFGFVKAIFTSIYSFSGFELVYILLPHMQKKNNIKKVSIYSMIFIIIFYCAVVILSLAVFTKSDAKVQMASLITLARVIDISGSFIERWYGVALTLYVLFFYTTFVNFYYFAAYSLSNMVSFKDIKLTPVILSPLIYVISLYPKDIIILEKFISITTVFFFGFTAIIFPSMLYISHALKSKRRKE